MLDRITDTYETGNDSGRAVLSKAALDIYKDYPVTGVGAVGFKHLMKSRYGLTHTVHNVYWYVLVTTGSIGFIVFILFIFNLLKCSWRSREKSPFSLVLLVGILLIGSKTGGALTYGKFY